MSPIESLYYAIGELAYAVASADGQVKEVERKKFHDMVAAELKHEEYNFEVSDIIFTLLDKDQPSASEAYDRAIKQVRLNSHYLSPKMKERFINVMKKVAEASPHVMIEEMKLIDKFKADISSLKGDPVFFDK